MKKNENPLSYINSELFKKHVLTKPKVFVDMDGVLCDFMGAFYETKNGEPERKFPQSKIGFFTNLKPMPDAIESFKKLEEYYDVWILTRPSFKNINCYSEKAQWVLDNLGYETLEKTIIAGDKSLIKGAYLIDDDNRNGQPEFEGEWIHFASEKFPNWNIVVDYLINKRTEIKESIIERILRLLKI